MVAHVQVVRSFDDADHWRVAVDGRCIVGFYGPDARGQAERHRDDLAELLTFIEPSEPGLEDWSRASRA